MYQNKRIYQKNDAGRKRMFDRRRYKHIGWCICDDPEVDIDTETFEGVKELLTHCVLMPHMEYDRKLGAFLIADFFDYSQDIVLEVTTYERYDTGFAENVEYYTLRHSDRILKEIDDAIDKEWVELLQRIKNASH